MSTLRVSAVNNAAATTGGLSIDSSGVVTGGLPSPNRNLLYNGAMQVAQRGTSTTGITSTGYRTADRWLTVLSSLGTWTQTVENDAPTGSGLRKSLKMLCTTASTPAAADSFHLIAQLLEGQDVQRLAKGTASAQQVTISFWVKSNVTGTYVLGLEDTDNSRMIAATYTISASATWEKKSVTFAGDTTGVLNNDNETSLQLVFWLGAGSNRTSGTLPTSWATTVNANAAVGQTNLAAATNNYWQVTGVQLEVGPTGTGFEFKSFGEDLAECQRYYCTGSGAFTFCNATNTTGMVAFPVTMRAAPTITLSSVSSFLGTSTVGTTTAANITLDNFRSINHTGTGNIATNDTVLFNMTAAVEL
jgi:phage gp37-like protein